MGAFVAGAVALAPAGSAQAAVGCSYDSNADRLTVSIGSAGDLAEIQVGGSEIQVLDDVVQVGCANGTPTTGNVDLIRIVDSSPGNTTARIDKPQLLAPGASDAGDDSGINNNEIEIAAEMGPGKADVLDIINFSGLVLGAQGIDPNPFFEFGPDADITLLGVELVAADGAGGDDRLDGGGGPCCGGPFFVPLRANGGIGDDELTGGRAPDRLDGGDFDGSDHLDGAGANDVLVGGDGADEIGGGGGQDTAEYEFRADESLLVTLGLGGADDGSPADGPVGARDTIAPDVENAGGAEGNDTLRGNGKRNILIGDLGADRLFGAKGNDALYARDGVKDKRLNCGKGRHDAARLDTRDPKPKGCEIVVRRKVPPPA